MYNCNICGAFFGRLYKLQQHRRLHTGEKPFACKFCPDRFSRKDHLHTHFSKYHAELMLLYCERCSSRFRTKDEKKSHGCIPLSAVSKSAVNKVPARTSHENNSSSSLQDVLRPESFRLCRYGMQCYTKNCRYVHKEEKTSGWPEIRDRGGWRCAKHNDHQNQWKTSGQWFWSDSRAHYMHRPSRSRSPYERTISPRSQSTRTPEQLESVVGFPKTPQKADKLETKKSRSRSASCEKDSDNDGAPRNKRDRKDSRVRAKREVKDEGFHGSDQKTLKLKSEPQMENSSSQMLKVSQKLIKYQRKFEQLQKQMNKKSK